MNKPIQTTGSPGTRCTRCGNYSAVPAPAEGKEYRVCLVCGMRWEVENDE